MLKIVKRDNIDTSNTRVHDGSLDTSNTRVHDGSLDSSNTRVHDGSFSWVLHALLSIFQNVTLFFLLCPTYSCQ